MSNSTLSIIIVNYNVKALLLKCIESIYATLPASLNTEIIVIDNASSDGSTEALKTNYKNVILIENKNNAGFAGANNQGLEIANGDFIFLLNPDTEVYPNAIEHLINFLKSNVDCAIVAPQLILASGKVQLSAWKNHSFTDMVIETFFGSLFERLNYPIENYSQQFDAKTLSGAALVFRKELLSKIGNLDTRFFWMEDIDFCFRAQQQGRVVYLPLAKITHYSGESHKSNSKAVLANQLLSKLKYYKKHSGFLATAIAVLCYFILILSRIIIFALLSPISAKYRTKFKNYIYTLKRFFAYLFLADHNIM